MLLSTENPVEVDEDGYIFIDRDPRTFRIILNYLRGYSHALIGIPTELNRMLISDAAYYGLDHLHQTLVQRHGQLPISFQPGPGVNPDGNRFRSVYGVNYTSEAYLVRGRHMISFEILSSEYVGIGLASDSCTSSDMEFHRTLNCCVWYMTGMFYSNFPHHRKDESPSIKFTVGDIVTIFVDMDRKIAEFRLKDVCRVVTLRTATKLRFAVTLKHRAGVRIIPV